MTGPPAQVLAEGLANSGATMAFGLPGGGPNLDVIGALTDHGIRFVLAHGETAACIMASTWGWLTGCATAAIVTRGPGATSAVNGAAQATLDRQPLLLVTDTVPAESRVRVPHQRIDQGALFAPVSKTTAVLGLETSAATIQSMLDIAKRRPAGCVHLDYDTSQSGAFFEPPDNETPSGAPDPAVLSKVAELVAAAHHPVVVVGVGALPAARLVRDAVECFGAPVLSTYQAVGFVPTEGPLFAGLFTNGASERPLLAQADLIIAIGLDMVEPIPAAWDYAAPVVSIAPTGTTEPYLPIQAEVTGDLTDLVPALLDPGHGWPGDAGRVHHESVTAALDSATDAGGFGPIELTRALASFTPTEATVTVDAGAHFLAIMPLWPVAAPQRLLISNGLATMGYAVPAAIGASFARPGEAVVALTGDGGLGMCLAELETIVRYQLPITVAVFNDAALSLIEIKQGPNHGGSNAVRYEPSDFAAIAAAMGMAAEPAKTAGELKTLLANHDFARPFLIDARIDPSMYPHLIEVTRGAA